MTRPETGVMQFGNDWPGVFIRGDNAIGYAMILHRIIEKLHDGVSLTVFDMATLRDLEYVLHTSQLKDPPRQYAELVDEQQAVKYIGETERYERPSGTGSTASGVGGSQSR